MFCYQLKTATLKLMNPPTVLSQHERDATEDDMPLITICPTNQTNSAMLEELGYYNYDEMLLGSADCNQTACTSYSWGANANLTFDELKHKVLDMNKTDNIGIFTNEEIENSTVFLPGIGFCKEFLTNNQEIEIYHFNEDDVRVLVTDRQYRSYIMPDVASHKGKEIFMKTNRNH